MISAADIAALIRTGRFTLAPEAECQAEMEAFLAARLPMGCSLSREHRLSGADRPDFLIDGRHVVEVKVRGAQRRAIERQLKRYAAHPEVESLILATNVSVVLAPMIGGKPTFVVSLGRAWL